MKISQHTIDRVFDEVNIEEVISDFMTLKKAGANYKGSSPFVQEKTPSFMVSPAKGIYKCFSSGNGGNAIRFLTDVQNMTFPEAIVYVAEKYGIQIDYDKQSDPEAFKAAQKTKTSNLKLMEDAVKQYTELYYSLPNDHPAKQEIEKRQLNPDELIQWQIGYAPKGDLLNKIIKDKGNLDQAMNIGLIKEKWDAFQNRVVYPIQDKEGHFVGFGGRALNWEKGDKYPKWINSSNNDLFNKDKVLYGLRLAADHIKKQGYAILVEGYNDVIAMHKHDCENTVGSCGTAFSEGQILLLKKYTKHLCFLYDADNAGKNAIQRTVPFLLKQGFKVEFVFLPKKQDPDDYTRAKNDISIADFIKLGKRDIILGLAQESMAKVGDDPHAKEKVINTIIDWVICVEAPVIRAEYITKLIKILGVSRKIIAEIIKKRLPKEKKTGYNTSEPDLDLPDGIDHNDVLRHGFYGVVDGSKTGYFFRVAANDYKPVSNFVMTPLFHKYDQDDNTRIIKIENGIMPAEIIELPSKALISVDQFRNFLFDKGAYFFDGNKQHLDKLNKRYLFEFVKAFELKTLGWQNEGFFAFFNASYNGKLEEYSDVGIVKHGEQHFFSPASSDIYKDFRKDDDMYENDRFLEHIPSELNFSQWAKLLHDVYGEHAKVGVPFVLMSLFRDLVFKVDNNAPFLYCYGQSKSGKSKFAESISNLFFKEMPAFNLNSGTDFAFSSRLARFKNCPVFFNEFDDNVVKDEWFQALKGAYDGEGRERGKGGSKRKTEIQKVNCSLILVGQYLSTKDDNSVLSRSLMRVFQLTKDRGDKQTANYNYLKEKEKEGLSGILTELLQHRTEIEKNYYTWFNESFKLLLGKIRKSGKHYEERVLRNYSAMLALYKAFDKHTNLPWKLDEYTQWIVDEIIKMSALISQTDILVDWWTTVETMFGENLLRKGHHFKIERKLLVRITKDSGDIHKDFKEPKEVLYLRVKNVQQLYARFKSQLKGNPIDFTSLTSYLQTRDYYIGYVKSERFTSDNSDGQSEANSVRTSAYLFDYKALEIFLGEAKEVSNLPF